MKASIEFHVGPERHPLTRRAPLVKRTAGREEQDWSVGTKKTGKRTLVT